VCVKNSFSDLSAAAVAGKNEPTSIATASSTATLTFAMHCKHSDTAAAAEQGLRQAGNSLTGYSTLEGSPSTGVVNIAATHGSTSVKPIMVNKALMNSNS
jgi:hypothetical protein